MSQNPKVSIIVPVYKAEKYLHQCVDSILAQTFSDFEVLLINDGSPDRSGAICDEYAAADPRVRVFHKPNGGVSRARNLGLQECCGEWIMFVDSDDWIDETLLDDMVKSSTSSDCVVSSSLSYEWPDKTIFKAVDYSKRTFYSITDFFFENKFCTKGDGGACSKLYKKVIIQTNNIKFLEGSCLFEDTNFTFEYISKCNTITIVSKGKYHYRHTEQDSLSKTKHSSDAFIQCANIGIGILDSFNYSDKLSFGYSKYISLFIGSLIPMYRDSNESKQKRLALIDSLKDIYKRYSNKYNYNSFNTNIKILYIVTNLFSNQIADLILLVIFKII